ncbi:tear acid lipase-like protein [Amblyomma americanum]
MEGFCRISTATVAFSLLNLHIFLLAENELELQARMTPCQLIRHFGYPCEVSYMTTEDGYVLEVDRIRHGHHRCGATAHGKRGDNLRRYPVLVLPSFLATSDMWFLNYPSQSPGFLFADNGFDVWAINSRESEPYSHHVTLRKNDAKYWQWSFDQIGRYDTAAGIDHVLNATGASKLALFCLSQGVTAALALLSTRPEYNKKVELVVAYGPVANLSNMGHPMPLLLHILQGITLMIDPLNKGAFINVHPLVKRLCGVLGGLICSAAITSCLLSSPHQLNETRLPMYGGHYPIGTTIQNFRHFYQIYNSKDFLMYDYGREENRLRYSQETPPAYPVERITSSFAFFSSEGDNIAAPRDVAFLVSRMQHAALLHHVVPDKTMRHLDFAVGYNATEFLHKVALDVIRKHVSTGP